MPVTSKARSARAHRCAAVVLGAALLVPSPAAVAAGDETGDGTEESSPVGITIDRDRKTLHEGDTVTYEITLRNHSDHHYRGLTVAQMLPQSLSAARATPVADLKGGQASWRTDLPGKGERKFTLKGDVGTVSDQQGTGEMDPAEAGVNSGDLTESQSARSALLSTSVCVQESVSVTGGKVKREGNAHGTGSGTDGGREGEKGGRASDSGATVGRILGCRSDSAMLQSASSEKDDETWLHVSLGGAAVLAAAAVFAWRRLRGRNAANRRA